MLKKLFKAMPFILITVLCFSACSKEEIKTIDLDSTKNVSEKTSTTQTKNDKEETSQEKITEKENSPEPTQEIITTAKIEPTTPIVDPFPPEGEPEFADKTFSIPEKILLYKKGGTTICNEDKISDVIKKVNEYIKGKELQVYKLAVDEKMIAELKANQKCIELAYASEQMIDFRAVTGYARVHRFNKILIPLDGDYSGMIFLASGDTYRSGPIKAPDQKCIKEILSEYF